MAETKALSIAIRRSTYGRVSETANAPHPAVAPIWTNCVSGSSPQWGGGVVGLSSIDGANASENETTSYMNFVNGRWHHIRLRVEPGKIQAWIDEDRVVDLETAEKSFSIRIEMETSKPLGIATWNTAAALKNLQLKKL